MLRDGRYGDRTHDRKLIRLTLCQPELTDQQYLVVVTLKQTHSLSESRTRILSVLRRCSTAILRDCSSLCNDYIMSKFVKGICAYKTHLPSLRIELRTFDLLSRRYYHWAIKANSWFPLSQIYSSHRQHWNDFQWFGWNLDIRLRYICSDNGNG